MSHVVIVESPAKCKTINKYLGSDYTVLASYGHIRDLPSKDGSVRPDEDFAMDYEISSSSQKNVNAIAAAVKGAQSLILATDPDREGEAISWHVLEALKQKKALKGVDVKRVSFSSITKKSVQDALKSPRDVDMDLVNAQQARRALDYLVGFSLSPVLWRKLPGSKSAGRVQSVALRLICDRETEIEAFISQEYWDITAALKNTDGKDFKARLTHIGETKLDKFALPDEAAAKKAEAALKDKHYTVGTVEKKQVKRNPYAPFTTSTLQQEASRKLGFGASRTMTIAQQLYEGVDMDGETAGLITYMRTDGVDVAPEAISAARDYITKTYGDKYLPDSPRVFKSKVKNAQEAHEAIRPTDPSRTPDMVKGYLNKDQLKLYDLVWKRLIASQMEHVVMDQVSADIITDNKAETFRASGSTIAFDGFYRIYREGRDDEAEEEEGILPQLNEGDALDLQELLSEQHFTQPPPRFSEASLVKKLEELGIGRPSTYASIISILQTREYVRLDKKRFIPEPRGRLVAAFLTAFFTRYVEYDFTAHFEEELDDISGGRMDWKDVLREFWKDFSPTVAAVTEISTTDVIRELNVRLEPLIFPGEGTLEERRKCPDCEDGKLSLKTSKFGAFVGCSNYPDCRYTKSIISGGGDGEDSGAGITPSEPKVLGNSEDGEVITLRKGPYGFYAQLGEGEKPKRTGVPKGKAIDEIDLDYAKGLLSLPRDVGLHPETGKKIVAAIGRFGPYLRHDSQFYSIKGEDDVLTVGINRAVTIIAEAPQKKKAEPLKILGNHPDDGKEIAIYDGRYGPYVKHLRTNAKIAGGDTTDNLTLERAVELVNAQANKKKPTKKKAVKKKKG